MGKAEMKAKAAMAVKLSRALLPGADRFEIRSQAIDLMGMSDIALSKMSSRIEGRVAPKASSIKFLVDGKSVFGGYMATDGKTSAVILPNRKVAQMIIEPVKVKTSAELVSGDDVMLADGRIASVDEVKKIQADGEDTSILNVSLVDGDKVLGLQEEEVTPIIIFPEQAVEEIKENAGTVAPVEDPVVDPVPPVEDPVVDPVPPVEGDKGASGDNAGEKAAAAAEQKLSAQDLEFKELQKLLESEEKDLNLLGSDFYKDQDGERALGNGSTESPEVSFDEISAMLGADDPEEGQGIEFYKDQDGSRDMKNSNVRLSGANAKPEAAVSEMFSSFPDVNNMLSGVN